MDVLQSLGESDFMESWPSPQISIEGDPLAVSVCKAPQDLLAPPGACPPGLAQERARPRSQQSMRACAREAWPHVGVDAYRGPVSVQPAAPAWPEAWRCPGRRRAVYLLALRPIAPTMVGRGSAQNIAASAAAAAQCRCRWKVRLWGRGRLATRRWAVRSSRDGSAVGGRAARRSNGERPADGGRRRRRRAPPAPTSSAAA